ncbi:MAG TPA: pyridoxamine 5'-phosphate oxidase family protein [Dehalococcoidia bacterium]|nr:pyridoxamine 5'-phosphate oxidase family protein [Dehalococcoidia bacterium]
MPELPLDDPVVSALLSEGNLARLAYVGLDGRPRVVPIWFQYRDGDIRMITGPKAEKARALAANGAVALTIDSSQPPYKVLLVQGDAALEEVEGMAPEYPDIVRRYLGPATEAYLAQLRIKRQVRIRVAVRSWRVFDFVRRYPRGLR